MNGRTQTGITACVSIDDYLHQVVKKHEDTRAEKEQDRIRHVDVCSAQTGPIFLTYRTNPILSYIVCHVKEELPVYDFEAEDGIQHRVWIVNDDLAVAAIEKAFAAVDALYIADGHHRAASAFKVGMGGEEPIRLIMEQKIQLFSCGFYFLRKGENHGL